MTTKPAWLTRTVKLRIGMALLASGLFTAVYEVVEREIGVEKARELFDWGFYEKDKQEAVEAGGTNTPPATSNVVAAPVPAGPVDAIDIRGAALLGTHKRTDPAKARVTDELRRVVIRGDGITMDYRTSGWPNNDSGIGPNIDGRVYIYWREGDRLTGGHFEWKRPNARDRTFENIRKGYLEGRQPPRGAVVWFVLVTNAGDRRTNVVQAEGVFP